MTHFLLDTNTASRMVRGDRATVTSMRRAGATTISISVITQSEMLFGAHLKVAKPDLLAAVRAFLARVSVEPWDADAAEQHALIRAQTQRSGRSAGASDLMIAAQALTLGATLVTGDKAIANLKLSGLRIVAWG